MDWEPSDNDDNAGTGLYGACCSEMDIWEANSVSAAYTPHVCTADGLTECEGTDCGDGDERYDGICDKDGCDFNSYRQGVTDFYGEGMTVDTSAPFTVVTQFITADNTSSGDLVEIRRKYVQNGVVIENSYSSFDTLTEYNSITDDYCNGMWFYYSRDITQPSTAQKTLFGDTNSFEDRGGLAAMGDAFENGMVLVMSLWDDHAVNMLW